MIHEAASGEWVVKDSRIFDTLEEAQDCGERELVREHAENPETKLIWRVKKYAPVLA